MIIYLQCECILVSTRAGSGPRWGGWSVFPNREAGRSKGGMVPCEEWREGQRGRGMERLDHTRSAV